MKRIAAPRFVQNARRRHQFVSVPMVFPPRLCEGLLLGEMLVEQGIRAIVIGAAALAAHRYVRHTEDIDLGVDIAVRDFGFLGMSNGTLLF